MIWKANGSGQYLPSDEIPKFHPVGPDVPQGQYAVKIVLDDPDASKFPIGAQASAAIYTNGETGASLDASKGWKARLQRSPREGPEFAPEPPFDSLASTK